ncbi:hypothetical protein DER44DRAFT_677362, partial [Fusarium oxysporum]
YFYYLNYKFLGYSYSKKTKHRLVHKDNTNSSPKNTKVNLGSNLIIYIKVFTFIYKYKIYKLKLLLVAKFKAVA